MIARRGEPAGQRRAQRERVVERAEHVDALELDRVAGPVPRTGARGDQQLAVAQPFATLERELVPGGVEVGRSGAEPPLHLDVAARQRGLLGLLHTAEQLLGQRRPRVGQVVLRPDHDQLAVVLGAPDGLRGAQAGQRRADDDDRVGHGDGSALDADGGHRAGVGRLLRRARAGRGRSPPSSAARRRRPARRCRARRTCTRRGSGRGSYPHGPWSSGAPFAAMRSASSSGTASATCNVFAEVSGWSPGPDRSTSHSSTVFWRRPMPSISTSTTSPGSIGREFAGVPLRTTSPGSSVISRLRSASW